MTNMGSQQISDIQRPRKRSISIMLLFLGLFFFPQLGFAQDALVYDFLDFTTTIQSVPAGGPWNRTSTWVQGRRPQAGDHVQINGRVVVDAASAHYAEHPFTTLHITEGSEIHHQSGILTMDVDNVYLETDAIIDATALNTNTLYNYGTVDGATVFPEHAVYNYGTLNTVKINTETPRTLIGFEETHIVVESNVTFLNEIDAEKLSLGNHEVFFDESLRSITLGGITSTGGIIHGDLVLENANAPIPLNITEITADNILVESQVNLVKDTVLNADVMVDDVGIVSHAIYGTAKTLTIHGGLDIESGGLLRNTSGSVLAHIHGDLVNSGTITSGISVYTYGDVDTSMGTIQSLYISGIEALDVKGLENVNKTTLESDIVSIHDISVNELRANEHMISFSDDKKGTLTLNDILRSNVSVTGNIIVNESMSTVAENITADTLILDADTHIQFTKEAHLNTNIVLQENAFIYRPTYLTPSLYLYKDTLVKPTAQLIRTVSSVPVYLAGSIDIQGTTQANNYRLYNPDTSASYTFAYSEDNITYTEVIQPESSLADLTLSSGTTTVTNTIKNGTILYWKTKTAEDLDYGQTHTINQTLYLEPDTEFFTITLPDGDFHNQHTISLIITAKDRTYTDAITLSINDTETTTVDIVDGTGTIDIMLPYEDDDMVVSVSEGIFSGNTDPFLVLPALPLPNFFIINHDDPVLYGTTALPLSVTTPTNPTYTGIAQITIPPDTTPYDVGMIDGSGIIDIPIPGLVQGTYVINVNEAHRSGSSTVTVQAQPSSNSGSGSYSRSITERITDLFTDDDEEIEDEEEPNKPNEEDPETKQEEDETEEPDIIEAGKCIGINPNDLSLHVGSRNDSVRALQTYLDGKGYDTGSPDGIFGPGTKRAVQEFQTDNGLTSDGVFGPGSYGYIENNCDDIKNKRIGEEDEVVEGLVDAETAEGIKDNNFVERIESFFEEVWGGLGNLWNAVFNRKAKHKPEFSTEELNESDMPDSENPNIDVKTYYDISKKGIEFIIKHEGVVDYIYLDQAGHPTIGIGHLVLEEEEFPEKLSEEEILNLFEQDIQHRIEDINDLLQVSVTQEQFDALLSLHFNIGGTNFKNSSVLRKLNDGDYEGASESLLLWNKIRKNGELVISTGLNNRRIDERDLFSNSNY